jgi:nanoRNase/pAp phosphatase (c-di-AMP/oligoRNAs hydrolase)
MILCEMLVLEWIFISQNTATSLLAGIYTDTGWLKHSNTSPLAYKMSSYLIALWAQIDTIVKNFFMKNSLSQIRLWGRIMKESFVDKDQILHSYVNQSLLSSYDCSYDDIGWVIDILNTTQGIKYSTLLTQKWDYIKWSLRTLRDDIDLTLIAKQFSGWWHKKASGFTTLGTIETFQILQLKT